MTFKTRKRGKKEKRLDIYQSEWIGCCIEARNRNNGKEITKIHKIFECFLLVYQVFWFVCFLFFLNPLGSL